MSRRSVARRLTSILTVLSLGTAISHVEAQGTRDMVLGLIAMPGVAPLYPVSNRGKAFHFVYEGEPFLVRVTLQNQSQATIHETRGEGWLAAVGIDLEGANGEPFVRAIPFTVDSVISRPLGVTADPSFVAAQEAQEARLLLAPDRLPPVGFYRLRVTYDRTRLSSEPGWPRLTRLDDVITVEILPVDTVDDRRNVLFRRGVGEWLAGRNEAAREVLAQLLSEHPNSVGGWYAFGQAWAAEGNCSQAIKAFQQARLLIDRNADPNDPVLRGSGRLLRLQNIERDEAKCRSAR